MDRNLMEMINRDQILASDSLRGTDSLRDSDPIRETFDTKQKEIGEMAREMAEEEWELFEFNLFVSASGKEHLDSVSKSLKELRTQEEKGEIDFSKYEDIAEEF